MDLMEDEWRKENEKTININGRIDEEMTFCYASSGGNVAGSEWISAEGNITSDTPSKFLKWIRDAPSDFKLGPSIYFNSRGGNLYGGLQLGGLVRKYGYGTSIGTNIVNRDAIQRYSHIESGECYSACAYAFLGGIERRFHHGDSYGVHQFYDERAINSINNPEKLVATYEDLASAQAVTGGIVAYVDGMDVNPQLIALAASTVPIMGSGMRILSVNEAVDLNVINIKYDEPFSLTHFGGVLSAKQVGYYRNIPIRRRIQSINGMMHVYACSCVGRSTTEFDGSELKVDLGSFKLNAKIFQSNVDFGDEGDVHQYVLKIPLLKENWSQVKKIKFDEIWPFGHANEFVDTFFNIEEVDSEIMKLVSNNDSKNANFL